MPHLKDVPDGECSENRAYCTDYKHSDRTGKCTSHVCLVMPKTNANDEMRKWLKTQN